MLSDVEENGGRGTGENMIKKFKMERLFEIIWVGPRYMRQQGNLTTHRGEGNEKIGHKQLKMWPHPGIPAATRIRKRQGMDIPLQPPDREQLCQHYELGSVIMISDFWFCNNNFRTERKSIYVI